MLSDGFEFYSLDDGLFLHILWSNFRQKDREKKLINAADIVTTVSLTTMIEALHEFGDADYSRVVYDAVDTGFYQPIKRGGGKDKVRILMVISGARYHKNHKIFLTMAECFPNAEFVLHTFSPVKTSLPNVVIDKIKYPICNELGACEGLRNLYNSADIHLFPSIHERLNNTVLEAIACHLPVVALNATPMPELIEDGKNGFLCNCIKDMEYSLSYLIEDEKARKEFGKKRRKDDNYLQISS